MLHMRVWHSVEVLSEEALTNDLHCTEMIFS